MAYVSAEGMAMDIDAVIRAKMSAGVLPAPESPDYVACGSTERCDGCDQRIISTDMEYGVKTASGRVLRLHRRCYWAWFDAWSSEGR